jgi:integrase
MHVLPKWRDKKLSQIRRADVRELIEAIEGDVLPNRVLTTLKTVFRFALSRDWIEASPAEGIEKPKADTARDRFLNEEEIARVWRATELLGHPVRQYVQTLLLTAQRRTEVASMRWDAVDLEAGTWTLQASETKNKRAHLVPLSRPVIERLKAMPRFGEYVFSTDGKTHVSGYAKVKQRLDEYIAVDGGEPMKAWRFHDFRRTASTHMVRLGVLEEVVAKVLNHSPQGVTAKVYALHRYESEKRSALDRWATEVMRLVAGKDERKVVELRPA